MSLRNNIKIIFALAVVAAAVFWIYTSNYKNQEITNKQVLEKLKTIILLPENSEPAIAIVTDAEALKISQPAFFIDAKNGYRVIVYPSLAILYDYKSNKIIKISFVYAPVNIVKNQEQ